MERPYIERKLNKRDEVWYHRRQAAWDLAHKLGEVTKGSYDVAFDLLNSCKNLALAFVRCDEQENEYNWKRINEKRDKLTARMDRLNERLRPYGCHITRLWCCENVYDYDFDRHIPLNDHGYLYFF